MTPFTFTMESAQFVNIQRYMDIHSPYSRNQTNLNFDESLRTLNMKTIHIHCNIICNLEILPQDKVYCLLGNV